MNINVLRTKRGHRRASAVAIRITLRSLRAVLQERLSSAGLNLILPTASTACEQIGKAFAGKARGKWMQLASNSIPGGINTRTLLSRGAKDPFQRKMDGAVSFKFLDETSILHFIFYCV